MFSKNIKLFLVTLLIGFLVFGIVSFAEQRTESFTADIPLPVPRLVEGRQFVLGMQFIAMTSESGQRILQQAKNEVEKRGWKLISNLDALTADLQRAGIENFINQDVDAIVHFDGQMETWKDLVIKAREKGIGFYVVDLDLRPGVIVNTTQSNGVVGAMMTYYGVNRLKETGNVLVLQTGMAAVYRHRSAAAQGLLATEWPNLKMVGYELLPAVGEDKAAFDITQNYLSRYDNDLQWVFAPWDSAGMRVARAIEEAGLTREECFVTGIDGGSQAYAEIREGTPFIATLSQPFELYTHNTFEVINQIQIEGIAPGEPDSMIPKSRTIYSEGVITTPENVPDPGTSIHELFSDSYYDSNNKEAWYFWGEPYMIK